MMIIKCFLYAAVLCLSFDQILAIEPADKSATSETRKLLDFLVSLSKNNKVIVGQQIGNNERQGDSAAMSGYHKYIESLVLSEKVGLVGLDYGYGWKPFKGNLLEQNEPLKIHWNKGGLITVMLSLRNPFTGGNSNDRKDIDIKDLCSNNSKAHADWIAQLDEAAKGLLDLQKNGVVVLWRPFHESNGAWFWWGRQPRNTLELMPTLWKEMFVYFTQTKGIHNLLWVYAASPQDNPAMGDVLEFYPGNEYVDCVGLDIYRDIFQKSDVASYETLLSTGKPFVLAEFGPGRQTASVGQFDYSIFLKKLAEAMPKTSYTLIWSDWKSGIEIQRKSLIGNQNAKEMLVDPRVMSLDEIRKNRD
jgi:mannan endo-1,4-beta-mannosidase